MPCDKKAARQDQQCYYCIKVGALVDAIKPQMEERYPDAVKSCPKLIEYYQYQNGIYLPMALLGLGGILFIIACRYVVRDKQAVEK